jgi:hypothetical protein
MRNHPLSHLSRRLLATLFLASASTAAWAHCCDGDDPGRMTGRGATVCMCVGADATTSAARHDTDHDTSAGMPSGESGADADLTAFTIRTPPRDIPERGNKP